MKGQTPIFAAVKHADPVLIWLLIKYGADTTVQDKLSRTALGRQGPVEKQDKTVAILMCHQASLEGKEAPQWAMEKYGDDYLLPISVELGLTAMVSTILTSMKNRLQLKYFTFTGETPLHVASREGHSAIVRLLLENRFLKPDVNSMDGGRTPLHLAAVSNHCEVVRVLLEHGADTAIHAPGFDNIMLDVTALEVAQSRGNDDIVQLIRNYQLKIHQSKTDDIEPLSPLLRSPLRRRMHRWSISSLKPKSPKK